MKNKFISWTLVASMLLLNSPISAYALTKNETVYGKLSSDGSLNSSTSTVTIINEDKESKISDYAQLTDILNINGDETYTSDGYNLIWNADGKNIYYSGVNIKKVPVEVKATYYLNNKEININDLLGQSGNVTIKLTYTNNDKHGKLYTPFVVAMGMILDNDDYQNISVTNGKVVDNGSKNYVVGLSTPGLYESLGLSTLKGMDEISINFDTTSFALPTIYNVITPKVIDLDDYQIFDKVDSLYETIDTVTDSVNQINEGSNSLAKGANTLKDAIGSSLNNTTSALSDEDKENIKNTAVNSVNDTYTTEYKQEIADTTWKEVKSSLDNSSDTTVTEMVTEDVTNAIIDYLKEVGEYDNYVSCMQGQEKVNNGGSMSLVEAYNCLVLKSDKTLTYLQKYAAKAAESSVKDSTYYVAENVAKNVSVSVSQKTAATVAEKVSVSVAENVADAAGAKALSSVKTIYENVSLLSDGANKLNDGITTFNNVATSTINNYVGDSKVFVSNLKKLNTLANNYVTFSGNNTTGSVKFILVMDGIKKEETSTNEIVEETKVTFLDRIKNLFK